MKIEEYRCPCCEAPGALFVTESANEARCGSCGETFPLSFGRPVLLVPDNQLFPRAAYASAPAPGAAAKPGGKPRWFPEPSVNLSRNNILREMDRALGALPTARVLIVGAGLQRNQIAQQLGSCPSIEFVFTDIDIHADVDCFCDAHDLPFKDGYFDALITTAVLEHVLYPERVAAEIARVVRVGGLVYSELPFMQQVHEGAYDFTRYSLSGHRRLLNLFDELSSGTVAGPGTALVWSLESFAASFFRSHRPALAARAATRLGFFWVKYFDHLTKSNPAAADGASCTYFLGKRAEAAVFDSAIIANYRGLRGMSHV